MFLLFGMRSLPEIIAIVAFTCRICGVNASQEVVKQSTKLTVFFIPLFSLSTKHYVTCSNCGGSTGLTANQAYHALDWAERNSSIR